MLDRKALKTSPDVALLTPVNSEHLFSGLRVPGDEVAFGSDAWQTLDSLKPTLDTHPIEVYIYASHPERTPKEYYSYWRAELVRIHVGAESSVAELRPETCNSDTPSARYWIVKALRPVKDSNLPVTKMSPYGPLKAKPYKEFTPKGPLLINYPGPLPGD